MKSISAMILGLCFGFSAFASDLSCKSADGFEISNVATGHGQWSKITVTKNGAPIVKDLFSNDTGYIIKDLVTDKWTQIVPAASVSDGVVSSLTLSLLLANNGGYTGIGTAVIFDGKSNFVVKDLDCIAP